MSEIVYKYAKKVYITDDNPRYENPELIRKTLKKFCPNAIDISDRRLAIQTAIAEIEKNDILIIAGKGHEKYQIIKNKKNVITANNPPISNNSVAEARPLIKFGNSLFIAILIA